MRHPFDGIIVPEGSAVESVPPQNTRRSLLKVLAGAIAALFGLAFSRSSAQQPQPSKNVLSLALGEAGGTALTRAFKEEAGDPTKDPTKMRKEEGGLPTESLKEDGITTKALGEEAATTNAVGEEGGKLTKALKEDGGPRVTTFAVGEEGASTRRVGEEGGKQPPRLTEALNEDGGKATTFAVGEEGGKD